MLRKTEQESKFQKFSLKVKLAEMKTLQKELGDNSSDLQMGALKTCNSGCICKSK